MPGTDLFSAKKSYAYPLEERRQRDKALKAAIYAETELFIERILALKAELS